MLGTNQFFPESKTTLPEKKIWEYEVERRISYIHFWAKSQLVKIKITFKKIMFKS